jgi:glycerol-3-phosphate dehydrogenase (NAD(P)+)
MVFEISTVLKNLGKDGNLANGLTGMGIIAAGAIRRDSLFFEMGYRMGKEMNAEKAKANLRYGDAGPVFLENIYKWSKENNIDLPLTEAIHKIFIEKIDLKEIRMWLFNRPFRKEFD